MTGLCECGCGEPAAIAKRTVGHLGLVKGGPLRFAEGHKYRFTIARANAARFAKLPPEYIEQDCGYDTPCWVWQRARFPEGYGIKTVGREQRAHRIYYIEAKGPIPDGLVIDHLCRNPPCVNPDHLEAVTDRVNILRGNGMGARYARATHCVHGHPWDEENTRYTVEGWRRCRACKRTEYERKKVAA